MCGVNKTFSECNKYWNAAGFSVSINKFSKDSFSYSRTSSPAPSTFPDFKAETKSFVTTLFPLEVLMNQKGFAKELIKLEFTILFRWCNPGDIN